MSCIRGLTTYWFLFLFVLLIGCSEDGIDGTGEQPKVVLSGTAAIGSPIRNTSIRLKDRDGRRRTVQTDSNGKYKFVGDDLKAPFLLSVKINQGPRLFSIATSAGVANIHPYTDFITRNWFSSRLRDIKTEFDDDQAFPNQPTRSEVDALIGALRNLIAGFLADFGINPQIDLIRSAFNADHTGFDRLLDHSIFKIRNNRITLKIKEPDTVKSFFAIIVFKLDLAVDITQTDIQPPTEPSGLIAIPASLDSVAVLWNSSTDNIGVSGYNIYRADNAQGNNLQLIATSPYPSYIDTGLTANTPYSYTVEAVDGAGNTSTRPDLVTARTLTVVDNDPPALPTNLVITEISNTASALTWTPTQESDVLGYNVWRRPGTDTLFTKVATTVASSYDDSNQLAATEYCYKLQSFDAKLNTTDIADIPDDNEVCHETPDDPVTDTKAPVSTANPVGGTYNTVQDVSLSCDYNNGACTIHYSLDGGDPTTDSPVYTQALMVNANTTLKFFAIDAAGNVEDWNVEVYEIDLAEPVSSVDIPGDTYPSTQTLTLSCDDGEGSGCGSIYFAFGVNPAIVDFIVYDQPLVISSDTIVNFYAEDNAGNSESPFNSEAYTITGVDVDGPDTFANPPGGTYPAAQQVTLTCNDNGGSGCATIYYTINGDVPTAATGIPYDPNDPTLIDITETSTLQFFGVDNAGNPEEPFNSEEYTIVPPLVDPLKVDVSVLTNPVVSNGSVLYAITLSNISFQPVNDVTVTYAVPTGVSFNGLLNAQPNIVNNSCNNNNSCIAGETASWNFASIPQSGSITIHLEVKVANGFTDGYLITAPITVSATALTTPTSIDKTVRVNNSPSAQLALSASKDPVLPGETYTLLLDVGNIDTQALLGTTLRVNLPAGVTGVTEEDAGVGSDVTVPGEVSWDLGNVGAGETLHREVIITAPDLVTGMSTDILKASAQLSYSVLGVAASQNAEHAVTIHNPTVTTAPLPELLLDISTVQGPVQSPASGYGTLRYNLTLSNISDLDVTTVSLMYRVPAGISFNGTVNAQPDIVNNSCNNNNSCDPGQEAWWTFNNIPAGGSVTIGLNVKVAAGQADGALISAPIRVTADQLDDTMARLHTVPINNNPLAHLALSANKDPVLAGETYTLLLDVGNIDTQALLGTTLRVNLPAGVTGVTEEDAGVGSDVSVPGEVSWDLGNVGAGETLHREVIITAPDLVVGMSTDILKASAHLTFDGNPEVQVFAEHAVVIHNPVTTTKPQPELLLDISTVQGPVQSPASGYGTLRYNLTLSNISDLDVTNTSVMYRVPAGILFNGTLNAQPDILANSCNNNNSCIAGEEAWWTFNNIPAGGSVTIGLNVNVSPGQADGTLISAPIRVTADQLDDAMARLHTVPINNNPLARLAVSAININDTVTPGAVNDPVLPGDDYTLSIDLGNIDDQQLTATGLRVWLPDSVTVVDADGGDTTVPGQVSWVLGTVDIGTAIHQEIVVTAPQLAGSATTDILKTTAELDFNGNPEVQVYAEHAVTMVNTALNAAPPLTVAISAPTTVPAGTAFRYTMTLTNVSQVDINNVQLMYRVPANISFNGDTAASIPIDNNSCNNNNSCIAGEEAWWTINIPTGIIGNPVIIELDVIVGGTLQNGDLISAPIRVMVDVMDDDIAVIHTVPVLN